MAIVMYHNPQCSKSRASLALLEEKGLQVEVIEYLQTPPTAAELDVILTKLGKEPSEFVRTGEDAYQEHMQGKDLSRAEAIALMVQFPRLIERPIVVNGDKAVIGRPPENILVIV